MREVFCLRTYNYTTTSECIMKKITLFLAILVLGASGLLQAQEATTMLKYAKSIQKEALKKHLEVLASDEYEGRETGERGQKMAAEYIKKHFQAIGLQGPVKENKDAYLQPFTLNKVSLKEMTIQQGEMTLNAFEEFFPYGRKGFKMDIEAVFAGYGLDEEKYSDYKGLDVKGKVVVIVEGEPQDADGNFWASGSQEPTSSANTRAKLALAKEKGASTAIIVYKDDKQFQQRNKLFQRYYGSPSLSFPTEEEDSNLPIIFTSMEGASKILATKMKKLSKLVAKMDKKGKSNAGKLSATITINSEVNNDPMQTENVLGYLEGTDKKDELLVVTAHYDHVGIINGEIHNGADDDGSGTVAVLEIAKAFAKAKKEGKGPRRSILFMTVTGEEKGLLGSAYYANNPIFPLENTIVNINTDMVGRVDEKHKDNPDYVYVIGSDMLSTELHNLHEKVAKTHFPKMELDYTYNDENDPNRYYYRSDHYNFAKNNIPVIFYFNGTHADYHKPTDTVEKINFSKIANIAQLNFCTTWMIANQDKRIEVDKK